MFQLNGSNFQCSSLNGYTDCKYQYIDQGILVIDQDLCDSIDIDKTVMQQCASFLKRGWYTLLLISKQAICLNLQGTKFMLHVLRSGDLFQCPHPATEDVNTAHYFQDSRSLNLQGKLSSAYLCLREGDPPPSPTAGG